MKYIVMQHKFRDLVIEVPVIFPNSLIHEEMAVIMKVLLGDTARSVSAGEYSPLDGSCHGKSSTLNLESRGEQDMRLILMYDYLGGFVG